MPKLQTYIVLYTLHSEYVALYHYVIELIPLGIIIKEVIDNFVMDSYNLKFVSKFTVYEDNNIVIVIKTSPSTTYASENIYLNHHWFKQFIGNWFAILNIESENQKKDIFNKGWQGVFFKDNKVAMGLLRLQMRWSLAINGIFWLKWIYYGIKGGIFDYWWILIFWFIILLYPIK